ncbi:bifunctional 2',3'-cyclic-nucleotide 2'-phosphodiesterase/3'-nucleotidase [Histidinibacterium lentulum]|uniref:bifunctional 2',3'-cyclic-nucleotide 2'-phosphodiesterase/3'-nucleotidase n=1 Tax=Histidinibacterium lentulum TaxID=2480588 RepID=UPI00162260CF|nr:bifunctional 2',3'-cyclic-nucleotide 2'-phosphodiesterase/3'-nucleotidase [Histidinibacterium lentulum]
MRLRILATSDLHAQILAHDYYTDGPAPGTGLAAVAALIRRLRDEVPGTLTVDNGDFLQGSALADAAAETAADAPNPVIAAMNETGYDAVALGNHDFNYGLPFLDRALAEASFPALAANLTLVEPSARIAPWIILERVLQLSDGRAVTLRVGFIGLLPPQTVDWDSDSLSGRATTSDIVDSARSEVPRLRAAGADIVVALCHSGIGDALHTPGMENAAIPLAAIPGIDALILGHTHGVFPGPATTSGPEVDPAVGRLHGKPAVMPGYGGSHLGCLDLLLCPAARGWRITEATARALPVGCREDTAVAAAAAPAHDRARRHMRRPIGRTVGPIHTFFSLAAPCPALTLVADAQRDHVTRLAPDLPDLPLLSVAASYRAGGWGGPRNYIDVQAGPLAFRTATELYPYPNSLVVLEISGADLADWLERAASHFRLVAPGARGAPLLHPGIPSYMFDVIDGVTAAFDLSRPARYAPTGELIDRTHSRIADLRHGDRPVDPAARFLVITNSYRHGGGGQVPAATRGVLRWTSAAATRDAVASYIADRPEVVPEARSCWRLAALEPATTVHFETGIGASSHRPPSTGRGIRLLKSSAETGCLYEIEL